MIRVLVINAFLFALPFMLTWAWMRFISAKKPDEQTRKLYAYAAFAGLVLVLISLGSYRFSTGNAPEGNYVSPTYKDGQIVPGRFE